jgi:hypothetical protein
VRHIASPRPSSLSENRIRKRPRQDRVAALGQDRPVPAAALPSCRRSAAVGLGAFPLSAPIRLVPRPRRLFEGGFISNASAPSSGGGDIVIAASLAADMGGPERRTFV